MRLPPPRCMPKQRSTYPRRPRSLNSFRCVAGPREKSCPMEYPRHRILNTFTVTGCRWPEADLELAEFILRSGLLVSNASGLMPNHRSSIPTSGRHTPGFRTSRRQFFFCNTLARRKGGRHWTFPQTAGGGCTQLPGSVLRGQNSICSATGRLVFPRELHTEPVWTEVSETVSSAVRLGYTPTLRASLTLFTSN